MISLVIIYLKADELENFDICIFCQPKNKPSISGGNIAYLLIVLWNVCFGIKLPQFIFQVAAFSNIISVKFSKIL